MPGPVKHELYGAEAKSAIARKMVARFGVEWLGESLAYTERGNLEAKQIIKVASLVDDALYLAGELQRGNEACHAAMHSVLIRLRAEWVKLPGEEGGLDDNPRWRKVANAIIHEKGGTSREPDQ
jgi:hypothetical protein